MIGRSRATPSGRAPEVVLDDLLREQQSRFADLDPALPPAVLPPPGDVIVVAGDGGEAAGVLTHHSWPAGSAPLLWSAAEVTELHPVLGSAGLRGAEGLVAEWRARIPARVRHASDSAAVVTWPSRDVVASRAFLDHGLVPLAVLAVRRPGPADAPAVPGPATCGSGAPARTTSTGASSWPCTRSRTRASSAAASCAPRPRR